MTGNEKEFDLDNLLQDINQKEKWNKWKNSEWSNLASDQSLYLDIPAMTSDYNYNEEFSQAGYDTIDNIKTVEQFIQEEL